MNRNLRVFTLAGVLLASLLSLAPAASAASAMQTYVSAMQPGWNLGNTLDAVPAETSWGNPPATRELIRQIAVQGFKSIRIPVTWTHHLGAAPDYRVDPAWMDRVQEVVDWSLDAGLYVMLNVHHDSWGWASAMPAQRDAVLARYTAVWTQIAARFRDYPEKLMLESINEPFFEGVDETTQMKLLDELNTVFVRLVRESGGGNATRPLVLPTLKTGVGQTYLDALNETITRLADPNLIATIHYYGFWPFSVNVAGRTTFDAEARQDVATQIDAAYDRFVSRGIPVVVGEYGLLAFDKDATGSAVARGEMLKFFEFFTHYAQAKNLAHIWWDNGQHFDRSTYQWRDPDLFGIIRQSLSGRSSTADTDVIFLRRGATAADAVLTLDLNGNTVVSLADGSNPLHPEIDYTLDGRTLTIKAAALSRHATDALGEKTVLTANFSAGPAWKIGVRYVDTPELQPASLDADGALTIPASFNGDLLATMEAVYAGGGNAGPEDWTAFKEFGTAFAPDYGKAVITITKKFFAGTTAGRPIDFTFHFRSGRTVTYRFPGASDSASDTRPPSPAPEPSAGTSASGSSGDYGATSIASLLGALALMALLRTRTRDS